MTTTVKKDKSDKLKGGHETLYSDAEDSDGQDDEDYEIDDDDEDSQGETGLSATPSVTASPQPDLQGNDQLGTLTDASLSLAASVVRTANDSTMLTNSFDVLSAVWLTQNANAETDKIQYEFLPVHPCAAEEDKAMSPTARGTLPKADQKCSGYQVTSDNQHVQEKLGKKIIDDLK
eukprot:g40166.t1